MYKYFILVLIFCTSLNLFSQKNKRVTINYEDLMTEISQMTKVNDQYVKYDSLLNLLTFMQLKLNSQDSILSNLKKNVNFVQIKTDYQKEIGYYIIVGAFKILENAEQLSKTKSKYPLTIYNFPSSKLNYVGYKVKLTDPFLFILSYFRQKIIKDAWVLKVTGDTQQKKLSE